MTAPSPFERLTIASENLRAEVLPFGATLADLRFAGGSRSLVLSFEHAEDFARVPIWAGAIAGPVANRIRGGRVAIEGKVFQMPLNEPQASLHSGEEGLHAQTWRIAARSQNRLTLETCLPHLHGGLPGNRAFAVTYALEGATLELTLTAQTDQITPINITAHPYWSLDGQADITGHRLEIAAEAYLPTDAHNLPAAEPQRVHGTAFDFCAAAPLTRDPRLDVNFCLGDQSAETPRAAARLTGRDGTTLEIATTTPGLQVYSGAFLPQATAPLRDGATLGPFAGIALEPQHWPDALHHRHFPSILLRPAETHHQVTRYTLSPA